jgi:hypothetical protein
VFHVRVCESGIQCVSVCVTTVRQSSRFRITRNKESNSSRRCVCVCVCVLPVRVCIQCVSVCVPVCVDVMMEKGRSRTTRVRVEYLQEVRA